VHNALAHNTFITTWESSKIVPFLYCNITSAVGKGRTTKGIAGAEAVAVAAAAAAARAFRTGKAVHVRLPDSCREHASSRPVNVYMYQLGCIVRKRSDPRFIVQMHSESAGKRTGRS